MRLNALWESNLSFFKSFFFYVTNPFFMASRKKCVMWALHSEAPLVCEKDGLMEKKLQLYNMF